MRRTARLSQLAPVFSNRPAFHRQCLASISGSRIASSSTPLYRSFSQTPRRLLETVNAAVGPSSGTSSLDIPLQSLPSPPVEQALSSAKLAALHSRLSLPDRFPLQTLARTLVTSSADPDPRFNNSSLSVLGSDLLGNYVSEHIICHYPRIPMAALFAAQAAYIGPKALRTIAREWGVEAVAEPGGEVDPGLLQHRHLPPGTEIPAPCLPGRINSNHVHRSGQIPLRIVYDDQFGNMRTGFPTKTGDESIMVKTHGKSDPIEPSSFPSGLGQVEGGITAEEAHASFVRALVAAIYLHCGRTAVKRFISAHFLSRSLNIASLFEFRNANRDLAILCGREGFEAPVARLLAETGRLSRAPVYLVGVFSGQDKLGEGSGASLAEARIRAATAALSSWYLYSPLDVVVPSETEDGSGSTKWISNHIDCGEVFR